MSSTYYLLCMSHDPATVITDLSDPESLPKADNLNETHPNCDFLIVRVSGGPVEIGCPPFSPNSCRHSGIQWADIEWLRLLSIMQDSHSEEVRKLRETNVLRCWDFGRLHRLRYELGTQEVKGD